MTQKILICGLLCWITTQSFAQVYEIMRDDEWTHPYEYTIVTHEFTVLDINTENHTLAFRHVYEMYEMDGVEPFDDYTGKPQNCNYSGMESKPYAGVILGIYNLKTLEYEHVFHVYKSVYYKNRCMTHEESTNALDSAKSMFQEYALNIDKKPKAIQFKQLNDSISSIKIKGINIIGKHQNIYDYLGFSGFSMLILELYSNNKLLFEQKDAAFLVMGSSGKSFWHSAYIVDNYVVFMNKTEFQFRPQVYIEGEYFYFSPIFQISDFQ